MLVILAAPVGLVIDHLDARADPCDSRPSRPFDRARRGEHSRARMEGAIYGLTPGLVARRRRRMSHSRRACGITGSGNGGAERHGAGDCLRNGVLAAAGGRADCNSRSACAGVRHHRRSCGGSTCAHALDRGHCTRPVQRAGENQAIVGTIVGFCDHERACLAPGVSGESLRELTARRPPHGRADAALRRAALLPNAHWRRARWSFAEHGHA